MSQLEDRKMQILADLATILNDDEDFLRKINRLTFGLLKDDGIITKKNGDKERR